MRLNEFGNDQGHPGIEDVERDHPELYGFMLNQVGQLSLTQKAVVDMTDNTSGHLVTIVLRPATDYEFIQKRLEGAGVEVEPVSMASGTMLSFSMPFAEARVHIDGRTETWQFQINSEYYG